MTDQGVATPGSFLAVAPQFTSTGAGPNQTDVFFIDPDGALSVAWAVSEGSWNLARLTAQDTAPPGSPLASAPHGLATTQTDVFLVDVDGALQHYYVDLDGEWHTQSMSAAGTFSTFSAIAASPRPRTSTATPLDGINVYVVDQTGTLVVYSAIGDNIWVSESVTPPGFTYPDTPLTVYPDFNTPDSSGELHVFAFDRTSTLNVLTAGTAGSWSSTKISGSGVTEQGGTFVAASKTYGGPQGQCSVMFVDRAGRLNIYDKAPSDSFWYGGVALFPQCDEPLYGFGSSNDLVMSNFPLPLVDVSITVVITEDIEFLAGSAREFAIQLNCFTYPDAYYAWEQFFVGGYVDASGDFLVFALINNWDTTATNLILTTDPDATILMANLPGGRIPAGYKFVLQLFTEQDTLYGVSRFQSTVHDELGNQVGFANYNLLDLDDTNGRRVTKSQLTAISGFEVDLVGFINRADASLTSGAGIVTYSSSSTLVPSQPLPASLPYRYGTGEGANVQYEYVADVRGGALAAIVQRFAVVVNTPYANDPAPPPRPPLDTTAPRRRQPKPPVVRTIAPRK